LYGLFFASSSSSSFSSSTFGFYPQRVPVGTDLHFRLGFICLLSRRAQLVCALLGFPSSLQHYGGTCRFDNAFGTTFGFLASTVACMVSLMMGLVRPSQFSFVMCRVFVIPYGLRPRCSPLAYSFLVTFFSSSASEFGTVWIFHIFHLFGSWFFYIVKRSERVLCFQHFLERAFYDCNGIARMRTHVLLRTCKWLHKRKIVCCFGFLVSIVYCGLEDGGKFGRIANTEEMMSTRALKFHDLHLPNREANVFIFFSATANELNEPNEPTNYLLDDRERIIGLIVHALFPFKIPRTVFSDCMIQRLVFRRWSRFGKARRVKAHTCL